MNAWLEMVDSADPEEKGRIMGELLNYYELDTLVMVQIYLHLRQCIAESV